MPLAEERALDFDGYRYHGRYTYEIPANWKVWVENASECYHCPTIHKHSFSDAFVDDADVYEYVDGDRVLGQFTVYNPRAKTYAHPAREGDRQFRYTTSGRSRRSCRTTRSAFPGAIIPTGPESCRFIADMFVHPDCEQSLTPGWRCGTRRSWRTPRWCCSSSPGCVRRWFRMAA